MMFDNSAKDFEWMGLALTYAQRAADLGEIPVGCVIVDAQGSLVAAHSNQTIHDMNPCHHAEILSISTYCRHIENYRFPPGATAYVTLEPCIMCAGAFLHARLSRLVIGARDSRPQSIHQTVPLFDGKHFNHRIVVQYGVRAQECQDLLNQFFQSRRQ